MGIRLCDIITLPMIHNREANIKMGFKKEARGEEEMRKEGA